MGYLPGIYTRGATLTFLVSRKSKVQTRLIQTAVRWARKFGRAREEPFSATMEFP
jgi:hypothetical protein